MRILKKEVFWSDDATQVPGANFKFLTEFNVHQLLAVPLFSTRAEPLGIFGVLDKRERLPISQEDIRRAQALAGHMTAALEVSRNLLLSEQHRKRSEFLSSLALENSMVRGAGFRAQHPGARGGHDGRCGRRISDRQRGNYIGVGVALSNRGAGQGVRGKVRGLVVAELSGSREPISTVSAIDLLGEELAGKTHWTEIVMARLSGGSGELFGALCLANRKQPLSSEDQQLLKGIAAQASVSLENTRFFTRIEQAKRHWIEIFDSISDFIVAHDEAGNVLRVNRSLAEFVGVQPQQLIGLNIAALLAMGTGPLPRSCPFCRVTGDSVDEYVHPVLERTFLVSTSQVHAASSEGLQTIHVLKDITDRREAERRYRELFDNIQEGLFFCSPDGRFIEVNDALVRMLGRSSRDELLHCDPREEVFPSAEHHRELFAEMERQGALRNREAVLKRKDGGAVHVLINAFAVAGAQGRISQYRGLMLDISGLKTYQAELQRERDFSGKILSNTQSLILVADTAGLVSYANRRWQVMGYKQAAILGKPLEALVAVPAAKLFATHTAAVLSGSQVDNLEVADSACGPAGRTVLGEPQPNAR